jgi:hypothetical protein
MKDPSVYCIPAENADFGCTNAAMLQKQLLNLQRTAFYTRYEDMLIEACRQLRNEAEIKQVDGWQTMQGTTGRKSAKSFKGRNQRMAESSKAKTPTVSALPLQITHLYAARNELVHANFIPLVIPG